ncbi:MAG: DUF547 domain-containing protein [Bryobacterales bacterium]|nr:DUF547 domain-containing protein [Bryobacterales bacterium]
MRSRLTMGLAILLVLTPLTAQPVSKGLSHEAWGELLKRYVREDHRVDYARWKADGTAPLDAYLGTLAKPFPADATAAERQAALTNAYNALTIRWILTHFPVKSIWKTKQPFTGKRHPVDGRQLSLDGIETELRETMGPLTHSVLVCAARSCPPLRREAYTARRLQAQLQGNTREWLANEHLNRFEPANKRADVSKIFDWYKKDFEKDGKTLEGFLAAYAPAGQADFLLAVNPGRVRFQDYDWGLNDTGNAGENYRGFYFDYLRNK